MIVPCVRLENVYAGQALAESKYTPTESCCSVRSSAPAHFRSAPLSTSQYIARVHCHRQKLSLRKGCSSSLAVRPCPALLEAVYTRPPRRHRLGRPQLRRRRRSALKQPRKQVEITCSRLYGLAGGRRRPGCWVTAGEGRTRSLPGEERRNAHRRRKGERILEYGKEIHLAPRLIYRCGLHSTRATPARADTAKTRASMRTDRCTKCRSEGDRRPRVPSAASCARRPTRIGLVTTARTRTKVRSLLSLLREGSGATS